MFMRGWGVRRRLLRLESVCVEFGMDGLALELLHLLESVGDGVLRATVGV